MAVVEIEGLDRLRERHGRGASDRVEAGFARLLSRDLEEPDVVGRWADATFLVLLPGTEFREAEDHLSRVLADAGSLEHASRLEAAGSSFPSPTPEDERGEAGEGAAEDPKAEERKAEGPKPENRAVQDRDGEDRDDGARPLLTVGVGLVDGRRHEDLKSAVRDADRALALSPGPKDTVTFAVHPLDADEEIEHSLRVLLIEDDPVLARLLGHRLRRDGMTVVHLDSGSDARDHIENQAPLYDIVLCDVKLPGVDGFELLQRFKETPRWAHVPVVMVTSMGRETDVVRAFELGADDYVLKPVSPGELIARIHRLLRQA